MAERSDTDPLDNGSAMPYVALVTHNEQEAGMTKVGEPFKYDAMPQRTRMIEAIEAMYPIDSENDGALRYVNGDDGTAAEPAPRYVLIQTHHNGRRWHTFSDKYGDLLDYASDDDEWEPFLLVDLDTGDANEVVTSCRRGPLVEHFVPAEPDPEFALPLESIKAIVAYSWPDEAEDFEREGEPEHHIFRDLGRVNEWLEKQKAATS